MLKYFDTFMSRKHGGAGKFERLIFFIIQSLIYLIFRSLPYQTTQRAMSGIGIVCENANFCGNETNCGEKNCPHGKKLGVHTQKKQAPVLVPH